MTQPTVGGCRRIELPRIHDKRGNLTFVEGDRHVPFAIARTYWLYDVPGGESRAGHAHRALKQLLIAASGSFVVTVDDGAARERVALNRSYDGLYIPPGVWREIDDFSSGAVCLCICSLPYDESDYVRDYDTFVREASERAGR
jgi:dTDP-4-dehydrorhamnose 3,5-epimerase-like enzyme